MKYNYEPVYVNLNTGFMFRYVCWEIEELVEHWHDYFELFLLLEGSATHFVNGKEQHLEENTLLFIRPGDVHKFVSDGSKVRNLNLTVSKDIMYALISYLSEVFDFDKMIKSTIPPMVKVSDSFKNKMLDNFQKVGALESSDIKEYIFFMKAYLADIMLCFSDSEVQIERDESVPQWLVEVCKQMYIKENFVAGNKRMIELSGKTQEHLSRTIKKHMNTTISEFVAGIRLEYAANMLKNSNMNINDICSDSGFENLTIFRMRFNQRYGITPSAYRKAAQSPAV